MSILITTYEGTHNHPLPISATAMASTTSAAASMLISGSSSSLRPPTSVPSSSNPNLHALNFNLSDPTNASANAPPRPRSFYLPNPTISSTPSYPTITLDLTSPPQFNRYTSPTNPRYSTSFNFSDSTSTTTLPLTSSSWSNGYLSNYGAHQSYTKSPMGPLGSLGLGNKQQQDNFLYQSYLQKFVNPTTTSGATGQQQVLTDSIAKAITLDPSFQSALAAAITSYVGGPGSGAQGGGGGDQGGAGNGCGSSFLTKSGSGSGSGPNAQQGGLVFLSSKSASPVENRENLN